MAGDKPLTAEPCMNEDGSISLSVWWSPGGGMMVRRDALDVDHPEHPVAVIERLGGNPDEYGYQAERLLRDLRVASGMHQEEMLYGLR